MARVPWKMCIVLAYYNVLLLALLQIYGEALAEERSNIPRLLKLSSAPISATPAQSTPPPPPPPRWARPPPPPPESFNYWWYYVYSSPPPPATALYFLPTPPAPYPSNQSASYSYAAIVALPIIAVVMIFLCSFIWTHHQRAEADQGRNSSDTTAGAPAPAGALLDRQGLNSKGLDGALVNKLPTLCFTAQKSRISKEAAGRKEYMYSCAVCISDFEEGETMRLLPACMHAFHKDCIDMWLFSHSTCPLCRLGLFNSKGDLILLEEEDNSQRGVHLAVDLGESVSRPLDHQVFSPLIKMFRRSQSSSQADMAHTRGLALQRSCSQPLGFSKVHPTHSF